MWIDLLFQQYNAKRRHWRRTKLNIWFSSRLDLPRYVFKVWSWGRVDSLWLPHVQLWNTIHASSITALYCPSLIWVTPTSFILDLSASELCVSWFRSEASLNGLKSPWIQVWYNYHWLKPRALGDATTVCNIPWRGTTTSTSPTNLFLQLIRLETFIRNLLSVTSALQDPHFAPASFDLILRAICHR